jgi:hypothetical protein
MEKPSKLEEAVSNGARNNGRKSSFKRKYAQTLIQWKNIIRDNHENKTFYEKVTREVALSLFSSFYAGNLTPKRQKYWENKLGVAPGTFTRYSATRGFAIFTGLEYLGAFQVVSPLLDLIPGATELKSIDNLVNYGFLLSVAVSAPINLLIRYPLSKFKGKHIPPPSLYAVGANLADVAGRGIAWGYRNVKDPIKKMHK